MAAPAGVSIIAAVCYNGRMAPPRLPQEYVERLVALCLDLPDLARGGAAWQALAERADFPPGALTGVSWHDPPEELAQRFVGSAANVVPAYDGPRRGWTMLGMLLQQLVAHPAVRSADREWLAGLIVRYRLIPLDAPGLVLAPALVDELAHLPPQPPPVWAPSGMPQPPGAPGGTSNER